MNALLFSDDVISEKYKNGSVNKYTTLMLSFLSNVLGYFFGMILYRLTNFSQCLELFAKEPKKEKIYIKKFKKLMKIIKIKLIMFFSFEFVFMIAFVYFLSAFCAVYHSSQWNYS